MGFLHSETATRRQERLEWEAYLESAYAFEAWPGTPRFRWINERAERAFALPASLPGGWQCYHVSSAARTDINAMFHYGTYHLAADGTNLHLAAGAASDVHNARRSLLILLGRSPRQLVRIDPSPRGNLCFGWAGELHGMLSLGIAWFMVLPPNSRQFGDAIWQYLDKYSCGFVRQD